MIYISLYLLCTAVFAGIVAKKDKNIRSKIEDDQSGWIPLLLGSLLWPVFTVLAALVSIAKRISRIDDDRD